MLLGLLGCKGREETQLSLQLGPERIIGFEAKSGFAHYYELPGEDDVLRIVLASYSIGCHAFTPPGPGEVFIAITVRVPGDRTLSVGRYPWPGIQLEPNDEEDEVLEESSTIALPFVRLAGEARALPPGGELRLTQFEPEPFGEVKGELAFRNASVNEPASVALLGKFSVRLCKLQKDPARAAPSQKKKKRKK